MIFTDCQLWDSDRGWNRQDKSMKDSWNEYKKISPNSKLYLFDLSGYGDTPLSTDRGDVYMISGWSDKIFDMMEALENGSTAVKEIEKIVL